MQFFQLRISQTANFRGHEFGKTQKLVPIERVGAPKLALGGRIFSQGLKAQIGAGTHDAEICCGVFEVVKGLDTRNIRLEKNELIGRWLGNQSDHHKHVLRYFQANEWSRETRPVRDQDSLGLIYFIPPRLLKTPSENLCLWSPLRFKSYETIKTTSDLLNSPSVIPLIPVSR